MSALTNDLKQLTVLAEKHARWDGFFRQQLHLMPPVGWLNDPNGLCQFKGIYHSFFQYAPFNVNGGVKLWGHYTSADMIDWKYEGAVLYPDQPFDCSGVYSGSALVEEGRMYLYYTGNVKLEDREDYDYICTGREANTILVTSEDGLHFSRKRELMRNSDYPSDLTMHVRDPKVWKEDGKYYMIQGARTKKNTGQAIVFQSEDRRNWAYRSRVCTDKPFGYMWECPDYINVEGMKILSVSVQGLTGAEWVDHNVYQSGYFLVKGNILGEYGLSEYRLWDYGFDYYAPQSFQTEDGRVVLIAWMGMPDCEEYTNRTIEEGWQHCFTFPREVYRKGDAICQRPVRELESRKQKLMTASDSMNMEGHPVYEAYISGVKENQFRAVLGKELILEYRSGRFEMRFADQNRESVSAGRSLRYADMEKLENVRILTDVSSAEVFLNDGEFVFTTRYYPEKGSFFAEAKGAEIEFFKITQN